MSYQTHVLLYVLRSFIWLIIILFPENLELELKLRFHRIWLSLDWIKLNLVLKNELKLSLEVKIRFWSVFDIIWSLEYPKWSGFALPNYLLVSGGSTVSHHHLLTLCVFLLLPWSSECCTDPALWWSVQSGSPSLLSASPLASWNLILPCGWVCSLAHNYCCQLLHCPLDSDPALWWSVQSG